MGSMCKCAKNLDAFRDAATAVRGGCQLISTTETELKSGGNFTPK